MKPSIQILSVKSKSQSDFEGLFEYYTQKISNFCKIDLIEIKSFEVDRSQNKLKVDKESENILEKIPKDAYIILCDESGKNMNSLGFSEVCKDALEVQKKVVFIIGGAFGVNDEVKNIAHLKICLSPFVLNHLMAKAVLLEQIFRTFTIINKIPYHNE